MMDQGYDHVGRPTNEEVKSKKRKKMMMVGIPVVAIVAIIGVIASQGGMSGMMGNSVYSSKQDCTCEKGWDVRKEKDGSFKCVTISKVREKKEISAYLVGDVVSSTKKAQKIIAKPDGRVTRSDIDYIKRAISNGTENLSARNKLVYDLNGDGKVDSNDLLESSYMTVSKHSKKGAKTYKIRYVCPETKKRVYEKDGVEVTETVVYKPSGDKTRKTCYAMRWVQQKKNAVCKDRHKLKKKTTNNKKNVYDTTGSNGYNTTQTPTPTQTQTPKEESYKETQSSTEESKTESNSSTPGIHGYSTSQYTTQYSTH